MEERIKKRNKLSSVKVGDRFQKIVVTKDLGTFKCGNVWSRKFECLCDCGNIRIAWATNVSKGVIKSCGCLKPESKPRLPIGEAAFNTVVYSYKHNARNDNRDFKLTDDQMRKLFTSNCYYCNSIPKTVAKTRAGFGDFVYNGIDRIDNDLGYIINNVVACCSMCNIAKATHTLEEFKIWVTDVFNTTIKKDIFYEGYNF